MTRGELLEELKKLPEAEEAAWIQKFEAICPQIFKDPNHDRIVEQNEEFLWDYVLRGREDAIWVRWVCDMPAFCKKWNALQKAYQKFRKETGKSIDFGPEFEENNVEKAAQKLIDEIKANDKTN